jgi:hypothetical protein
MVKKNLQYIDGLKSYSERKYSNPDEAGNGTIEYKGQYVGRWAKEWDSSNGNYRDIELDVRHAICCKSNIGERKKSNASRLCSTEYRFHDTYHTDKDVIKGILKLYPHLKK